MKNIKIIMLIMGFAAITACASNDAMDAAESDAEAKAEMMKEEQSAAMDEKKTEAEADLEASKAEAEAEAEADMKESADAMVEQAEAEAEVETAVAQASGNLVSTCKNGGEVRVISVVYDNVESDAVCEVTYEKSTGVQTLWSAQNDRDYCLDKAAEFVKKQEGWGWTCSNLE